jgi:RHS repeat-associated protein
LTDFVGAIVELYSFDAYGNAIGFDPSVALTEFLYSGEQFDSKIGQQYLRQRYYDPATGRFNRLDPFLGDLKDPLSLHKYLYTHADPVNGIDPSGRMNVMVCVAAIGIGLNVMSFEMNILTANHYYRTGDTASGNEYMAWALVDLVFICLPFVGPGASRGLRIAATATVGVANTSVKTLHVTAVTLSKLGLKAEIIYGYLAATAHALLGGYSYATSQGNTGSSNSGGTPQTDGSWISGGQFYMSEPAAQYQQFIARKFGEKSPIPGSEFKILNYFMDGVDHTRKVFIDAKGNYAFLFEKLWKTKDAEGYVKEAKKMVNHSQLARQYGYKLEYYVAEQEAVPYFEKMAKENSCHDVVKVIFEPFPK